MEHDRAATATPTRGADQIRTRKAPAPDGLRSLLAKQRSSAA
jgi:hypothetical protein